MTRNLPVLRFLSTVKEKVPSLIARGRSSLRYIGEKHGHLGGKTRYRRGSGPLPPIHMPPLGEDLLPTGVVFYLFFDSFLFLRSYGMGFLPRACIGQ